ncbi:MAG: biotin transporter BioY [Clostridiales bacterium]|jgi:biotin transport system substrate-specific component|nr:biotin transporter BioY [Clostridiales bacterium]
MRGVTKTRALTACAMFAAFTAVFSQISIPIGPVPINLATLSVLMAGGLLGARGGACSQIIFLLTGAAGAPVFSGFRGGFSALAGPTGGYIVGYVLAAWFTGFFYQKRKTTGALVFGMIVGSMTCYAFGLAWFMIVTSNDFLRSISACVIPFLPGDALKITAAALLSPRLSRAAQGNLNIL